jgi:hypothetical protein
MKKLTRRQFLKATGAAAGMAVLGQACAPIESPTEPPTPRPPEEMNILAVGTDYKFPPCCDYTGDYWINNPPVRPVYGVWAKKFTPVIDLLNNPEKYFPNTSDEFIRPIRNSLGFTVDKLFQGDTHSARNALAVVAYMLIHDAEIELQLQVPKNITKENAAKLLTISYANREKNTDLWDMVSFPTDFVPKEGTVQPSGSAAINKFITMKNNENKSKYPLLSNWLERLQQIADSMELWTVYRGDLDTTDAEHQNVIDRYQILINDCPPELEGNCPSGCKDDAISDAMVDNLAQSGYTFNSKPSYDEVMASLAIIYLGHKNSLVKGLNNFDSLESDKWLGEMSKVTQGMKDTIVELSAVIDEKNKQTLKDIEARKRAREEVSKPDLSLWDIIPCCLEESTWGRLKSSLGDWWGAKKYIVLVGCAIVNVPIIVASAGTAVLPAIGNFVGDFLEGMIGSGYEIVGDFIVCIFNKCDR